MIISNSNSEYIKVTSDNIQNFIDNLTDYDRLSVKGTYNCCCEPVYNETIEVFPANSWGIDLTDSVDSRQIIEKVYFQNLTTNTILNALVNPIDLGYILANCTSNCTLSFMTGMIEPTLKADIDAFFSSLGVTSNVTVTVTNNFLLITNVPSNFKAYNISFFSSASPIFFSYTDGTTQSDKIFIGADGIYIKPIFFGLAAIKDGIYKVDVKMFDTDGNFVLESNCAFIDISFKCLVASVLQNIMKEAEAGDTEGLSTIIHLLHYGLTNGSNCGCNCDELCEVFTQLNTLLISLDPKIQNNCGC